MLRTKIVAICQAKCNLLAAVFRVEECKQSDRLRSQFPRLHSFPLWPKVAQSGAVFHSGHSVEIAYLSTLAIGVNHTVKKSLS